MALERRPSAEKMPPTYTIDLSKGWDTVAQIEIFLKNLKKMPFYRQPLLHSGFDADGIGKSWHSAEDPGIVYCTDEQHLGTGDDDPLGYALGYENPAIAVYDPAKLEPRPSMNEYAHSITDPTALIALIRFKF